ncbi:MAG: VWA domain-containing protein [Anaerolineae bacterium]|nr:VWA domain-containing protein [Anaerolineae bacterium]
MKHRRGVLLIYSALIILILWGTSAALAQTAQALAQPVNIVLVFDASGSMAAALGGERKIDAARRAMEYVIANLPDDVPNLNVGFRIYGHEGDNSEAQRPLSCQSTNLLVPVLGVDPAALRAQTFAWEPTGWTPIALALQEAALDLDEVHAYQSCQGQAAARNVIIMVTDGEETCDGNPCQVAQSLAAANIATTVHIIGFGLTPDVAATLTCIPQNGGVYADAQDGDSLARILIDMIGQELEAQGLTFDPIALEDFEFTPLEVSGIALTPVTVERIRVTPGGMNDEGTFVPPSINVPVVTPSNLVPGQNAQATFAPGDSAGGDAASASANATATAQSLPTPTAICPLPQR